MPVENNFKLISMDTGFIEGMIPLRNVSEVVAGYRLFFELGYYVGEIGSNWVRTGVFQEINNVQEYIKNDKLMDVNYIYHYDYLKHHNYMIIKSSRK